MPSSEPRGGVSLPRPLPRNAVAPVLLPVPLALLVQDDVAVPRLTLGMPLLPPPRLLPAEAPPSFSRGHRCAQPGPARWGLAGARGPAPVREQIPAQWLRRPAFHGESHHSFFHHPSIITLFPQEAKTQTLVLLVRILAILVISLLQ